MHKQSSSFVATFLKMESAGGILLIFAAALAIVMANSPFEGYYQLLLSTPLEIRLGPGEIAKPLLLWINDGLMAVFFFLVGLELKRELIEGELSDKRNIILPGIGAIGGMLIPALVYLYFNYHDPIAVQGWAIPAATDIAFALGILTLLGSRVPTSLKIFLTSLAIFDDIGAIVIIALFYTSKISVMALVTAALCTLLLAIFNYRGVISKSPYLLVGLVMWVATLKSGVHATLAGVVLAMFIPLSCKSDENISPLKNLEHDLHSVVAFFVLPVFAFANAGISLTGVGVEDFLHDVPIGILLGLFVGKQVGIFRSLLVVDKTETDAVAGANELVESLRCCGAVRDWLYHEFGLSALWPLKRPVSICSLMRGWGLLPAPCCLESWALWCCTKVYRLKRISLIKGFGLCR